MNYKEDKFPIGTKLISCYNAIGNATIIGYGPNNTYNIQLESDITFNIKKDRFVTKEFIEFYWDIEKDDKTE